MPAQNSVDFIQSNNPIIRAFLARQENFRQNGQHDRAIAELNTFITVLEIFAGLNITATTGAGVSAVVGAMLASNNQSSDSAEADQSTNQIQTLAIAAGGMLIAAAGIATMNLAICRALKQLYTYLSLLYKENESLKSRYYWAHRNEFDTQEKLDRLNADREKDFMSWRKAVNYARISGFSATDGALLWLSASFSYNALANNNGLSEPVLNLLDAGADPDTTPSGLYNNETILWHYAINGNWRSVKYLIQNYPNINLNASPRNDTWEGHTVLIHAAINYQWELVDSLCDNEAVDINVVIKGTGTFAHMQEWVGKNALWFVSQAGKSDIVVKLIKRGAIVDEQTLQLIITRCNFSAMQALIDRSLVTAEGIIDSISSSGIESNLLQAVMDSETWRNLSKLVKNPNYLPSEETAQKIAEAAADNHDHRLLVLINLGQINLAKNLIKVKLLSEVASNPIIRTLIQYDTDIIDAYLALDANTLQDMFDPITHQPVLVDPVRLYPSGYITLQPYTLNLYERKSINSWIKTKEQDSMRLGKYFSFDGVQHPELGDKHRIDPDSIRALSLDESHEIAKKVAVIMDELTQKVAEDYRARMFM